MAQDVQATEAVTLERVAVKQGFPEGPVAMRDGSLLYVDIKLGTLSRLAPNGAITEVAHLGGGPNGVAIGPDGAAYVCNNGGIYDFVPMDMGHGPVTLPLPEPSAGYTKGSIQRVDLATGKVTVLYDACEGKPLWSPDDIVFDKDGGFWFTDSGYQSPEILKKGGLYYGTPDGKPLRKAATIATANGVGLSPDGKTVYVADTLFGRLWALDLDTDAGPGVVKPGPLPGMPGRVVGTLPGFQWVDSLKVLANGDVCVATLISGAITTFATDGSLSQFRVGDLFTTNLCFGGADMRDVWITASSTGTIYKARWPEPGLPLQFTA